MKRDLFHECNDQGMTVPEFESLFCQRCRNTECERAGWSTSSWDERISTQVDRLLINPNIATQEESSRWEGIANFVALTESEAQSWDVSPIEINTTTAPVKENHSEEVSPERAVVVPAVKSNKALNTPAQKSIIIGGDPLPTAEDSDPWAVPTNKVTVGGTFKMGD